MYRSLIYDVDSLLLSFKLMLHGTTFKDDFLRNHRCVESYLVEQVLRNEFWQWRRVASFYPASETTANNGCHVIFLFSLGKCARTKYKNEYCQQCCKLTRVTCQRILATVAKKIVFKNRPV